MKLPLLSWSTTITKLGYKVVKRKEKHVSKKAKPNVENLEARQMMAADITNFMLVNDTGAADNSTTDPRVKFTVTGLYPGFSAKIEFDHHANGSIDSFTTTSTAGQVVTYDPRNADPTLSNYAGNFTLNYRLIEKDMMGNVFRTGTWKTFQFNIEHQANPEIEVTDPLFTSITDGMSIVNFGTTGVGAPVDMTFTVHNWGVDALTLNQASLTVPAGFSIVSSFATSVAPGSSTSFTLRFNAATAGQVSGQVSFTCNDQDEGTFNFQVMGNAQAQVGEIDVTTSTGSPLPSGLGSVDFGSVAVNQPKDITLKIRNLGQYALAINAGSITVPNGFLIVELPATSVAAGAETTIKLRLTASAIGNYSGNLVIPSNDTDEANYSLQLLGIVTADPTLVTVEHFGLWNDTETSNTDKVTADPRLTGRIYGDLQGGYVHVEFDLNGDTVADSHERIAYSGSSFLHEPRFENSPFVNAPGAKSIGYRAVHYSATGEVIRTTAWNTFNFTLVDRPNLDGITISGFGLFRDTDTPNDLTTFNPKLAGILRGVLGTGTVDIEFDHNNDGQVNGVVSITKTDTAFIYDPRKTDASLVNFVGAVNMRMRLVKRNESGTVTATGNWTTFNYNLTAVPNGSMALENVHLLNDTGESNSDKITDDLTIVGNLANLTPFAVIQVDRDNDSVIDEEYLVDHEGKFEVNPVLSYGEHTLRLRTLYYDANAGMELIGPWSSLTLNHVPKPIAGVGNVGLKTFTGDSQTGFVTSDPTLLGQLEANKGEVAGVRVEFDIDGDGDVEQTTVTDRSGNFEVLLKDLAIGAQAIKYRTAHYDVILDAWRTTGWGTFNFTLQGTPVATVDYFRIFNDTSGNNSSTTDNRLIGQISGVDNLAGVRIELDFDGDGKAEGEAITNSDGKFHVYPPIFLPGAKTVQARAVAYDSYRQADIHSSWSSTTFTYAVAPLAAVQVGNLGLVKPPATAGGAVSDATISGTVSAGSASIANTLVELDLNNDGVTDATTRTDSQGKFIYTPRNLSNGQVTIGIRSRQWNYNTAAFENSQWSTVSFNYQQPQNLAPEVATFAIYADPNATVTGNPVLAGKVTDDTSLAGVTIEFDYDNDHVAEAFAFTKEDGSFVHVPPPLAYGQKTVRARAVQWDADAGVYKKGAWKSFTFTYQDQGNVAPDLVELTLAAPKTPGSTDTTTPVIRGLAVDQKRTGGFQVEIDSNNDGTVDQTINANDSGEFNAELNGLQFGSQTVKVRTREVDSISGQIVNGSWRTLTFNYVNPQLNAASLQAIALKNDTGTANDKVTTDGTITGAIQNDGALGGVVVQFDHNHDGYVDGQVTTDANGNYTYTPSELQAGSQSIWLRTKDVDQNNLAQYGSWTEFTFTLEQATTTANELRISEFKLKQDTGSNTNDGATSNSTVQGQIAGPGSLANVTVEIDFTGDGISDASVKTDADGKFEYAITNLQEGYQTASAIVVRNRDFDTPEVSEQKTLNFVYSETPDGETAQGLVTAIANYNEDWQESNDGFRAQVLQIREQFKQNQQNAFGTLETAVRNIATAQQTAVTTAKTNFATAVTQNNQARAAYANTEAANLQAAITSQYGSAAAAGATAGADISNAFKLPEANGADIGKAPDIDKGIPLDSQKPDVDAEDPTGNFDFNSDPVYKAAVAAAEQARQARISAAEKAFKAKVTEIQVEIQQQFNLLNADYFLEVGAAKKAYATALANRTVPNTSGTQDKYLAETVVVPKSAVEQKEDAHDRYMTKRNETLARTNQMVLSARVAADLYRWSQMGPNADLVAIATVYEDMIATALYDQEVELALVDYDYGYEIAAIDLRIRTQEADAELAKDNASTPAMLSLAQQKNTAYKDYQFALAAAYAKLEHAMANKYAELTNRLYAVPEGFGLTIGFAADGGTANSTAEKMTLAQAEAEFAMAELGYTFTELAARKAAIDRTVSADSTNAKAKLQQTLVQNELDYQTDVIESDELKEMMETMIVADCTEATANVNAYKDALNAIATAEETLVQKHATAHHAWQATRITQDGIRIDANHTTWRNYQVNQATAVYDYMVGNVSAAYDFAVGNAIDDYWMRIDHGFLGIFFDAPNGGSDADLVYQNYLDSISREYGLKNGYVNAVDGLAFDLTGSVKFYKTGYYGNEKTWIDNMATAWESFEEAISKSFNDEGGFDLAVFDALSNQAKAGAEAAKAWLVSVINSNATLQDKIASEAAEADHADINAVKAFKNSQSDQKRTSAEDFDNSANTRQSDAYAQREGAKADSSISVSNAVAAFFSGLVSISQAINQAIRAAEKTAVLANLETEITHLKAGIAKVRQAVASAGTKNLEYDKKVSAAVSLYDKTVAGINKACEDGIAQDYRDRDDAMDLAHLTYERAYNSAWLNYELFITTAEQRDALIAAAAGTRTASIDAAYEAYPKAVVRRLEARVVGARTQLVTLAGTMKSERDTLATGLKADANTLSEDLKVVDKAKSDALIASDSGLSSTIASQTESEANQTQTLSQTLASSIDGATSTLRESLVNIGKGFITGFFNDNATNLAAASDGSAALNRNAAQGLANANYVNSATNAEVTRAQDETTSSSTETADRNSASSQKTTATASADKSKSNSIASAAAAKVSSHMDSILSHSKAVSDLGSTMIVSQVAAGGTFTVELAEAIKARDVRIAGAWVTYVDTLVPERMKLKNQVITQAQYDGAKTAADNVLAATTTSAKTDFANQAKSAAVKLIDALHDALETMQTGAANAFVTMLQAIFGADNVFVNAVQDAVGSWLQSKLNALSAFGAAIQTAIGDSTRRKAANDKKQSQANEAPRESQAALQTQADNEFAITANNKLKSFGEAQLASSPSNQKLAAEVAVLAGRGAWLASVQSSHALMISKFALASAQNATAKVEALGNLEIARADNNKVFTAALDNASKTYQQGVTSLDRDIMLLNNQQSTDYQQRLIDIYRLRNTSDSSMTREYSKGYTAKQTAYVVNVLHSDQNAYKKLTDGYQDILRTQTTTLSNANRNWTIDVAASNKLLAEENALASKNYANGTNLLYRNQQVSVATAAGDLYLANEQASATTLLALNAADNAQSLAETNAYIAFKDADFAARVAATSLMAQLSGSAYLAYQAQKSAKVADWWVNARLDWLTRANNINSAKNTAAVTLADRIVAEAQTLKTAVVAHDTTVADHWLTQANTFTNAQYDYAMGMQLATLNYATSLANTTATRLIREADAKHDVNVGKRGENDFTTENYNTEMYEAGTIAKGAVTGAERAWRLAQANQAGTGALAQHDAKIAFTQASGTADVAFATILADSKYDTAVVQANASWQLNRSLAEINVNFSNQQLTSFANAMTSLAGTSSYVWADHDAATAWHDANSAAANGTATLTNIFAATDAQKQRAIDQADAVRDNAISSAQSDAAAANSAAVADRARQAAQNSANNALGNAGGLQTQLPTPPNPGDSGRIMPGRNDFDGYTAGAQAAASAAMDQTGGSLGDLVGNMFEKDGAQISINELVGQQTGSRGALFGRFSALLNDHGAHRLDQQEKKDYLRTDLARPKSAFGFDPYDRGATEVVSDDSSTTSGSSSSGGANQAQSTDWLSVAEALAGLSSRIVPGLGLTAQAASDLASTLIALEYLLLSPQDNYRSRFYAELFQSMKKMEFPDDIADGLRHILDEQRGWFQVHHTYEQSLINFFKEMDPSIDIHAPKNLRLVPSWIHEAITAEQAKLMEEFGIKFSGKGEWDAQVAELEPEVKKELFNRYKQMVESQELRYRDFFLKSSDITEADFHRFYAVATNPLLTNEYIQKNFKDNVKTSKSIISAQDMLKKRKEWQHIFHAALEKYTGIPMLDGQFTMADWLKAVSVVSQQRVKDKNGVTKLLSKAGKHKDKVVGIVAFAFVMHVLNDESSEANDAVRSTLVYSRRILDSHVNEQTVDGEDVRQLGDAIQTFMNEVDLPPWSQWLFMNEYMSGAGVYAK